MRYREAVWKQRLGEAQAEIRLSDAAHKTRMESLFGPDWEDPSLYAIVLNSARVPVKDCVEQIVRLAESAAFQETQESRNVLRDHLKVAGSPMGESYN